MALIVTIKPVVMRAQQRRDGSYNVKIRITFKRRYRILSTNLTAYPRDLARSGEIKGAVLLDANRIVERMYGAVAELNWYDMDLMDVDDVVRWIRRSLRGRTEFRLDFLSYAEAIAAKKKPNTARNYRTAIGSFRDFLGREELDISELNTSLIKQYVDRLNSSPKSSGGYRTELERKKGVSARAYTRLLSAIYNEAAEEYNSEEDGIVRIKSNPFRRVKIEAQPSIARISRPPEFIQKLIDAAGDPSVKDNQRRALEVYLISFALMGANTVDLLSMSAPDKDGVITYRRSKTTDRRADGAVMQVRVEPCILPLIRRRAGRDGRLLDLSEHWSGAGSLNAYLRRSFIAWAEENGEQPFTMYSARHSWATIGRSGRVGLSKSLIDECLAHSTNQLVDVYAERDWSILWEANRKVLALFDWSNI